MLESAPGESVCTYSVVKIFVVRNVKYIRCALIVARGAKAALSIRTYVGNVSVA